MIDVDGFQIADADLAWRFSRASGPGGQHVNTTDTRVQLTFDLANSTSFPHELKQRMLAHCGPQVVVVASVHRSQLHNRRAAEDRLVRLLRRAMQPPPAPRVRTKPSRAAVQRRIDSKKRRSQIKQWRHRPDG